MSDILEQIISTDEERPPNEQALTAPDPDIDAGAEIKAGDLAKKAIAALDAIQAKVISLRKATFKAVEPIAGICLTWRVDSDGERVAIYDNLPDEVRQWVGDPRTVRGDNRLQPQHFTGEHLKQRLPDVSDRALGRMRTSCEFLVDKCNTVAEIKAKLSKRLQKDEDDKEGPCETLQDVLALRDAEPGYVNRRPGNEKSRKQRLQYKIAQKVLDGMEKMEKRCIKIEPKSQEDMTALQGALTHIREAMDYLGQIQP